jgi:hypothetical protein
MLGRNGGSLNHTYLDIHIIPVIRVHNMFVS